MNALNTIFFWCQRLSYRLGKPLESLILILLHFLSASLMFPYSTVLSALN